MADSPEIRTLGGDEAQAWWTLRLEALRNEPFAFSKSPEEHEATSVAETGERLREKPGSSFTLGAFDDSGLIGIASQAAGGSCQRAHGRPA